MVIVETLPETVVLHSIEIMAASTEIINSKCFSMVASSNLTRCRLRRSICSSSNNKTLRTPTRCNSHSIRAVKSQSWQPSAVVQQVPIRQQISNITRLAARSKATMTMTGRTRKASLPRVPMAKTETGVKTKRVKRAHSPTISRVTK